MKIVLLVAHYTLVRQYMLHRALEQRGLRGVKSAAAVLRHPTVAGLAGQLVQASSAGVQEQHGRLEQRVLSLASRLVGAQHDETTCSAALELSPAQWKQLSRDMINELDHWVLPERLAELGSPAAIAEHLEGPGLLPLALPDGSGPVPLSYAQEQMLGWRSLI